MTPGRQDRPLPVEEDGFSSQKPCAESVPEWDVTRRNRPLCSSFKICNPSLMMRKTADKCHLVAAMEYLTNGVQNHQGHQNPEKSEKPSQLRGP
jgi:hypothetical protein